MALLLLCMYEREPGSCRNYGDYGRVEAGHNYVDGVEHARTEPLKLFDSGLSTAALGIVICRSL